MRPINWTNLFNDIGKNILYDSIIEEKNQKKMQLQFEVLIIPYLPAQLEPGRESKRKATLIKNLRVHVSMMIQRTVKRIEEILSKCNDCKERVAEVMFLVGKKINSIRDEFGITFSYFPLFLEFEKYDQGDVSARTATFNDKLTSIIHSLSQESGQLSLPHHLIPGIDSVRSAIEVVQTETAKLLKEASGWAHNDLREYEQFLNRIMKILIKQVFFIYVSQPLIRNCV